MSGLQVEIKTESRAAAGVQQKPAKVVTVRQGELVYKMVVSGETFDAHDQLMNKVKEEVKGQVDLAQSRSDDYNITIVFCPIISRMGPDVESALKDVKGGEPVILVLMHHTYEAKFIPNVEQERPNVQLQVNVFFHETKSGLLICDENKAAICEIKNKILDFPISRRCDTSRNAKSGICCFM